MARKRKFDFTGVTLFEKCPEGEYVAKITKIEEKENDDSGEDILLVTFKVMKGENKGAEITERFTLSEKMMWKFLLLLAATGKDAENKRVSIDLDKLIGKTLIISVTHNESSNGKTYANVDEMRKLTASAAKDDEDDFEEEDDDFDDEDDEDEEEAPAPKKKSKKKAKKPVVVEEDDEDEEDDEEDEITAEVIEAMKKSELKALCKKHKLPHSDKKNAELVEQLLDFLELGEDDDDEEEEEEKPAPKKKSSKAKNNKKKQPKPSEDEDDDDEDWDDEDDWDE